MHASRPEFKDLVERALQREVAARRELRPHAQLAIAPNAPALVVEEAYQRLRSRYDAASFDEYGPVAVASAQSISDLLRLAYEAMRQPERAQAIEQALPSLQPKPRADETYRALETLRGAIERRITEALAHRAEGRTRDAIRVLESVLVLDRQNLIAREALAELRAELQARNRPNPFSRWFGRLFQRRPRSSTAEAEAHGRRPERAETAGGAGDDASRSDVESAERDGGGTIRCRDAVTTMPADAVESRCSKCHQGSVLLVGQAGRRVVIDGTSVEVPRDFLIPTCDHCGAQQLHDAWESSLSKAVANARVAALRSARTDKMGILTPPANEGATMMVNRSGAPASFAVGELVADSYEILRVLGVGGMGTVYEAQDRALNRRVALKVPQSTRPELSLRKEARALAAIRHPSMVAVHAILKHRDIEFLVMELIRGTTLHDHIQKRVRAKDPFTVREVLDTLIGIAEGLAAVHASGIAHRDVKPANIMLAPADRTVLMDFGLFTPEFERLDTVAGSPEYMAPEIYAAAVDPGAGHLVDVYALGVIAYELLTGHPPYRGASAIDTLGMHLRSPIPDVVAERSDVPAELAGLIVEMLAKAPGDRPQGSEDVLGRLRALRTRQERGRIRQKFTVLIVDDDADFAETMRALVRAALPDADVSVARDGQAALSCVSKQVPTVMLLDLNMPRMNGLELCMAMRGAGLAADCEIISVNGAATAKDRELLQQLGVRQTLTKTPMLSRTVVDLMKTSQRRWLTAAAS